MPPSQDWEGSDSTTVVYKISWLRDNYSEDTLSCENDMLFIKYYYGCNTILACLLELPGKRRDHKEQQPAAHRSCECRQLRPIRLAHKSHTSNENACLCQNFQLLSWMVCHQRNSRWFGEFWHCSELEQEIPEMPGMVYYTPTWLTYAASHQSFNHADVETYCQYINALLSCQSLRGKTVIFWDSLTFTHTFWFLVGKW